jgi:hypothetical protein
VESEVDTATDETASDRATRPIVKLWPRKPLGISGRVLDHLVY